MYGVTATETQDLNPGILVQGLGEACPITPADLQAVRARRMAMKANSYDPLAAHTPWSPFVEPENRGKQPLTEVIDGVKKSWRDGHSEKRLRRVTPISANTGLILGGASALVALDIDPNKKVPAAEQQQFSLAMLRLLFEIRPELRAAPLRLRCPGSALFLLRADRVMTKIKVAGERGAVELLGEGQQFLVDGWHLLSLLAGLPIKWEWYRDRAPWSVPVAELPVLPAEALAAMMDRIRASGLLGPPVARPTTTTPIIAGRGRLGAKFPATERLNELFRQHAGLVKPAVRELIEEVGKAGEGRHDALVAICGRIVFQGWPHQQAVDWLVPIVNEHFQDGDWTDEVERALNHARNRTNAQLAKEKSIVWSNSNV
jgi:hypothetical protein